MLPKVARQALGLEKKTLDTETGTHLATNNLRIRGAVHAPGEAYLTINEVYGDLDNNRVFSIKGSTHDASHEEVDIGETFPFEMPPDVDLPSPRGFTEVMSDEYSQTDKSVYIDSLVIFDEERPAVAKLLNENGYECYSEVALYGNVHDTGTIKVTIDKVFIF